MFSNGEGLVGAVFLGDVVDGAGGCEGANGDDFAEAHGLVIFGGGMFVPHPDEDFLGSEKEFLWEGFGIELVFLSLVNSFGPGFGNFVLGSTRCRGVVGPVGGSLLALAWARSSRHSVHAAMKQASSPFLRSSSG